MLAEIDWTIRAAVYRHFIETTEAPDLDALSGQTGMSVPAVRDSLRRLADTHHLVLTPGSDDVRMAHPFSAVPTDYPVEASRGRYWANCAWDALGIPAMLRIDARIESRCPESGQRLELRVQDSDLMRHEGVIHLLVPAASMWDDIGFT